MRYTLTDFTNKKKLLEWLNYDGNPPKALVRKNASRYGTRFYQASRIEEKPVTDESTLEIWWRDYRANLCADWEKSPANPNKPLTRKQFVMECLRSLGIKGGTVAERIKKAIAAHPDLYEPSQTETPILVKV